MSELLIRNGTMVDGTAAARYCADVLVADGGIAEIGQLSAGTRRTIDATGLIVAPGFIDPHTDYDAQICWDRSRRRRGMARTIIGVSDAGMRRCTDPWCVLEHGLLTLADDGALVRSADRYASIAGIPLSVLLGSSEITGWKPVVRSHITQRCPVLECASSFFPCRN